jgi:hypothetical protein
MSTFVKSAIFFLREREKVGGGEVRDTRVLEGGNRNKIYGFEGSQAVPASPFGRCEACARDSFNFNF